MKKRRPVRIVVVSSDPQLASQVQRDSQGHGVSVVGDLDGLQEKITNGSIDGVVLGKTGNGIKDLASLDPSIDLTHTVLLAGPLPALEAASRLEQVLGSSQSQNETRPLSRDLTLEEYVESKLENFVRAMKLSSAGSLYPTFIKAVERPLIELALRETNGNQIQASQLLGMNRNTLRKKIAECKISVKRKELEKKPKEKE